MNLRKSLAYSCSLLGLGLPLLVGCGGGEADSPTASTEPSVVAPAQQPTTTTDKSTLVQDGVNTAAAESVAVFLDSLRRGNEAGANGVLTAKARVEMPKTDYVIQPLGTPEGQFEIGRVSYPYETKDVALVECLWTEPATADTTAIAMDLVCEVHQEPAGWRISGLAINIPETGEAMVLDFEDAVGLQRTIDIATGVVQPATQAVVQQNGLPTPGSQLPAPGFGTQPTFPAGTTAAQPSGTTHIALPPLPGQPIQR